MIKHFLIATVFSSLMCLAGPPELGPGVANAQACLSPAEARTAVQEGRVVSLSQIRGRIVAEAGGEVVSAQLCSTGGQLVYLVNVLSRGGEVKRLTVNAGNGTIVDRGY